MVDERLVVLLRVILPDKSKDTSDLFFNELDAENSDDDFKNLENSLMALKKPKQEFLETANKNAKELSPETYLYKSKYSDTSDVSSEIISDTGDSNLASEQVSEEESNRVLEPDTRLSTKDDSSQESKSLGQTYLEQTTDQESNLILESESVVTNKIILDKMDNTNITLEKNKTTESIISIAKELEDEVEPLTTHEEQEDKLVGSLIECKNILETEMMKKDIIVEGKGLQNLEKPFDLRYALKASINKDMVFEEEPEEKDEAKTKKKRGLFSFFKNR